MQCVVQNLRHFPVSHGTVEVLRTGIKVLRQILECSTCAYQPGSCLSNNQNTLAFTRLYNEMVEKWIAHSDFLRYSANNLPGGDDPNSSMMPPQGYGEPQAQVRFLIDDFCYRRLVLIALEREITQMDTLARRFKRKQVEHHRKYYKRCDGEFCIDVDGIDVCPKGNDVAERSWCMQVIEDVKGMVKKLGDELNDACEVNEQEDWDYFWDPRYFHPKGGSTDLSPFNRWV